MTTLTVTAQIPATSANLGPGFDCMGLALEIFDTVSLTECPGDGGDTIEIHGEGAGTLPHDESHLILHTIRDLARDQQWSFGRLRLQCINRIPQGQGLGSSASAITAGLVLAKELARRKGIDVSGADLFQIGSDIDGHPDNVGPCLFGGMTVSWSEGGRWERARLIPHPDIAVTMAIPATVLSTKVARDLIPAQISHSDAVRNSARAALCIHAFTQDPALLLPATRDFLHQQYRAAAYQSSYDLVQRLRSQGIAAAISGAGPAVIVFSVDDVTDQVQAAAGMSGEQFSVLRTAINTTGARITDP